MGKKAKSKSGKQKRISRKDLSSFPAAPPEEDLALGSTKLLAEPKSPGLPYKVLDQEGYDDGGVGDLTLVIDLEDVFLRKKMGETAYINNLKADRLPRVLTGQLAQLPRREQKIKLAGILFADDETEEDSASEVYVDKVDGQEDEETKKQRLDRLNSAKFCLKISAILREVSCASLSLAEIAKRYLAYKGKEGANDALRCAQKAVEIASDGFYDNDEIIMESEEEPKLDPKHERNATYPGLAHALLLKLFPLRVSHLCLRSAFLQLGNALSALDRNEEAREAYLRAMPILDTETRCGRIDWERASVHVNVGNTYKREGNYEKSLECYAKAKQLGEDHLAVENGNCLDGTGIKVLALRARALALNKAGRTDEAKKGLKEVLELQMEWEKLKEEKKKQDLEEQEKEKAAQEAPSEEASEKATA